MISLRGPHKFSFANAVGNGRHEAAELWNKSTIKRSETVKASCLCDCFWLRPRPNCYDLARIYRKPLIGDNISQEVDLFDAESTLFPSGEKLITTENGQDGAQVLDVFVERGAKN